MRVRVSHRDGQLGGDGGRGHLQAKTWEVESFSAKLRFKSSSLPLSRRQNGGRRIQKPHITTASRFSQQQTPNFSREGLSRDGRGRNSLPLLFDAMLVSMK